MKNDEQIKTISGILDEAMSAKGLNIEKLAQITDIPINYLNALYSGDFKKLPPAPYARGYINRIAEVLNIDTERIWQIYKDNLKTSGEEDKLPLNRFALKKIKKRKFIIIGLVVAILIYIGFQGGKFLGIPSIEISNPSADNAIVNNAMIDLRGKIDPQDKLTINGEDLSADENGYFEKNFSLEPGLNTIEFKVKRLLGKETKIARQVIYQQ